MIERARVVFAKEVLDNLRDRRSVVTALLFSVLGPLLLIPVLHMVSTTWNRGNASLLTIAVEGAERAPGLVEYMRQRSIEITRAPDDPAQAVRDLRCDLVLVIPPGYEADFEAGRPAIVRIVTDHSRSTAAGVIQRVSAVLDAYSGTVGGLRLMARGVSPNVVSAVAAEIDDVATPESEGANLLGIVPMFIMSSLFLGGLYIAVDTMAGERERGSLEPLISTPLTAAEMILGKVGAVFAFQLVTMTLTLVAFALVIDLVPYEEVPGLKFRLNAVATLEIFAAMAPLVLPVAALQVLVASRGRTVKEAISAGSMITVLPMASGMFLVFTPYKPTLTSMAYPLFGQNLLVNEVLRSAPVSPLWFVAAGASAVAMGALLTALAVARGSRSRLLIDR